MNKKPNQLALLPIYLLLLDLAFGVMLNIKESILPNVQDIPKDGLPVSPEFAFGWLQVLVNMGMVLIISWSILRLLFLYVKTNQYDLPRFLFSDGVAVFFVLMFSLPAWWQWFWAIRAWLSGNNIIDWHNPRYLIVSICQVYLLWLPFALWRARKRASITPKDETPFLFSTTDDVP